MKKIELTSEQLSQILKLRQNRASWLRVEHETGIARRIAKRAFENWENNRPMEELKVARTQVATDEFREHLRLIVQSAKVLVDHLPARVFFHETKDAQSILDQIWKRDICEEFESPERFRQKPEKEQRRLVRQNLLLFQSLKTHAGTQINWRLLEDWKQTWDECRNFREKIHKKASELLMNIINDPKSQLKNKIKNNSRGKDIVEDMVNGIVEALWRGIIDDKPEEGYTNVRTIILDEMTVQLTFAEIAPKVTITLDRDLAEEVAKVCIQVAEIVCKEDLVYSTSRLQRKISDIVDKVDIMLEPLALRPLILRTRCELCPA